MEYIKATKKDIDAVYELVQETIKTIYPKYYLAEVVDFFCEHYCKENIAKNHDSVELDASLPASHLYEKRGYKTVKHEKWNVENGVVLVYEIMEKFYGLIMPEAMF